MTEPEPVAPSRRPSWAFLFWVLFGLVLLFGVGVLIDYSEAFTDCIHTHKNREEYQALHERVGVVQPYIIREKVRLRLVYVCVGDFADKDNGALVALTTAIVAFFTFTLWRSTERLWKVSVQHGEHMEGAVKAAQLAAEVAASADAPLVLVEKWSVSFGNTPAVPPEIPSTRYLRASASLKNFGRTPAFLVKECIDMRRTFELPEKSPGNRMVDIPYGRTIILPDKSYIFKDVTLLDIITPELEEAILSENEWIWIFGFVAYYDFLGTEWRYGFCTRWYPAVPPIRPDDIFTMEGPETYTYRMYRRKGEDSYTEVAPR